MAFLENLWNLYVDMSFYIVIGLIFTGILHAFVNKDLILKHIGKKNTSSVIKASVLGVPLPLCSCGVVPTALYLGKNGGSKGAVVSFLTSTPQTGVDSLIATYGLMGPLFAVYRAIAAFISGIVGGIMTNIFSKNDVDVEYVPTSSCCSNHEPAPTCCSHEEEETHGHCSCGEKKENEDGNKAKVENLSFLEKCKSVFTYAFGDFLDDIVVNFVVGLIVAALISTLIPEEWLSNFTNPILSMFLMLIIGIPMYICSTSSIPIAVSLIMKGISPGAAFVFLFTGPVTNIASLMILIKALGKKIMTIYLISVGVCSILFGLLLDYIIKITNYTGINDLINHYGEYGKPMYMTIVAIIFGIVIIKSLIKRFKTR